MRNMTEEAKPANDDLEEIDWDEITGTHDRKDVSAPQPEDTKCDIFRWDTTGRRGNIKELILTLSSHFCFIVLIIFSIVGLVGGLGFGVGFGGAGGLSNSAPGIFGN